MQKIRDLTNYCEDLDELQGRQKVMAKLSRWISSEQVSVLWQQESERYPTFTPVARPAPDMLINGAGMVYAVCVAHGDGRSTQIRKRVRETVDIWERMVADPPDYDCNLSAETPSAVLVATGQSPDGHLFSGRKNREHPVKFSEDRQQAADEGVLPQREFAATQEVIRSAWGFAKGRATSEEIGMGALLSSRLSRKEDNQSRDTYPAVLYYTPGTSYPHHWKSVPWFLWE